MRIQNWGIDRIISILFNISSQSWLSRPFCLLLASLTFPNKKNLKSFLKSNLSRSLFLWRLPPTLNVTSVKRYKRKWKLIKDNVYWYSICIEDLEYRPLQKRPFNEINEMEVLIYRQHYAVQRLCRYS